jgi:hypothetical protein
MELESIADVHKLQAAFVKSLNATAARFLEGRKVSPQVLLDEKRQLLTELRDRLKAATDGRTEAIRAFDREIAQRESAVANLEAELKNDERAIGRKAQAQAATPARKKRTK